jgi:predicted dehydrogenase
MSALKLGIIGYGLQAQRMEEQLRAEEPSLRLVAIADPRHEEIRARLENDGKAQDIHFYESADLMLEMEDDLDGVLVATSCSHHSRIAAMVLQRRLPLYLEKPVATRREDLMKLAAAVRNAGRAPRAMVSFPLRVTPMVKLAQDIIASDSLGTVEHIQAWNNVTYGWVYYQTWYRDDKETGGLFLQKATHDFDYINALLEGRRPRRIAAMTSKRVFRGERPAGLQCFECPDRRDCRESPYDRMRANPAPLDRDDELSCAFAVDTGNEDSGSALIEYDSGMHVVYSQNFYVRGKAGRRGATVIGYKGTMEFDWYTKTLTVHHHHSGRTETHSFDASGGHGGGDTVLAANFVALMRGEAAPIVPIEAGLISASMCLTARDAASSGMTLDVIIP